MDRLTCVLVPLLALLGAELCSGQDPSVVASDDLAGAGMCMLQKGPAERKMPLGARLAFETSHPEFLQAKQDAGGSTSRGRCRNVGGRAWVSQKGVDYLVKAFLPVIVDEVEALQLLPKTGSAYGFNYNVHDIVIQQLNIDSPKATFRKDEGLGFDVQGVSVVVKLKYAVEGSDWYNPLYTSGHVTATVSQQSGGAGIVRLGVSPMGLPVLNLTLDTVNVKLASLDFGGTKLSSIVSFFSDFLQEYIEELIGDKLKTVIEWFVNDEFNSYLDVIDLQVPIPLDPPYNISAADVSLCEIRVGSNYISVDSRAEIIDLENSNLMYPTAPLELPLGPPMSSDDFEKAMFSAALTKWTINSGLWLYQERDLAKYTLYQSDIPENSPIVLNAEFLRTLVGSGSGLPYWYWAPDQDGKKKEFAIALSSNKVPSVEFSDGKIETTVDTTMAFELQGVPTANQYAFSIQVPLSASVAVKIEDGKVKGDLSYVSALPIKLVNAVTQVSMFAVSAFIEVLSMTALVPLANSELAEGFPIPTKYGITVKNTSIEVGDYLVVQTDADLDTDEIMKIIYGEEEADNVCPPWCTSCSAALDEFGAPRTSGGSPLVVCHTTSQLKALGDCVLSKEEESGFQYLCKTSAVASADA